MLDKDDQIQTTNRGRFGYWLAVSVISLLSVPVVWTWAVGFIHIVRLSR